MVNIDNPFDYSKEQIILEVFDPPTNSLNIFHDGTITGYHADFTLSITELFQRACYLDPADGKWKLRVRSVY